MILDVKSDTQMSPEVEKQQEDIPDGGLVAWLQVLGGFFMFFNSWYVMPLC